MRKTFTKLKHVGWLLGLEICRVFFGLVFGFCCFHCCVFVLVLLVILISLFQQVCCRAFAASLPGFLLYMFYVFFMILWRVQILRYCVFRFVVVFGFSFQFFVSAAVLLVHCWVTVCFTYSRNNRRCFLSCFFFFFLHLLLLHIKNNHVDLDKTKQKYCMAWLTPGLGGTLSWIPVAVYVYYHIGNTENVQGNVLLLSSPYQSSLMAKCSSWVVIKTQSCEVKSIKASGDVCLLVLF